jgi:hypothetical protein
MKMQDLTTERDAISGTTPYQFRPFIRVNKQRNVKLFGYPVRPRSLALALLFVAALGYGLVRVVLGSER